MSTTRAIGAIGAGAFVSSFVAGNELDGGRVLETPERRPTDYTAIHFASVHSMATQNGLYGEPGPATGRRVPLATPAQLDALTDTWGALGRRIKGRLAADDNDALELFELDLARYQREIHRIKRSVAIRDAALNPRFVEQAAQQNVTPEKLAELAGFLLPFDQLVMRREPIRLGPAVGLNAALIGTTEGAIQASKRLAIAISAADFASQLEQADFEFFMRELSSEFAALPRNIGEWVSKVGAGVGETVAHGVGGLFRGLLESPFGAALAIGAAALTVRAGARTIRGKR